MSNVESDAEVSAKTTANKLPVVKATKPKTTESKPSKSKDSTPAVTADSQVHDKQIKAKNKAPVQPKSAKSKAPVQGTISDIKHVKAELTSRNSPKNELEPSTSGLQSAPSRARKAKTVPEHTVVKDEAENADKDEKLKKKSGSAMVLDALKSLQNRKGSSAIAIKKYIEENYNVEMKRYTKIINDFLKKSVESGEILQITGKGATGSFKLANPPKKKTVPKTSKTEENKPVKLTKKQKMAIVSTPKRKSFTVLASKRKSLGAPKATKPRRVAKKDML